MSHSFSFGGGGNDSSLNPLAFDSPVVRERHSRYSRLTESFNISRIAGVSQTSGTGGGGGLFNDTTIASGVPVTPTPFHAKPYHHQTSISGDHFGGGGGPNNLSNVSDIGNSISLLSTTLQLGGGKGPADNLNTSGEGGVTGGVKSKPSHEEDMARLAIFESFYELNQRLAGAEETFELLQQFDHTCDVNLLACKEMLERKVVRADDDESAYLSKFCSLVRLERNSWRLLAALYHDRLVNNAGGSNSGRATVASSSNSARPEDKEGVEEAMDVEELVTDAIHLRLSDFELAERALKRNAALREMQIVIDWLESIYDEETLDKVQFYSDGPSYWENTLHALKMEKRKKGGGGPGSGVSPRLFSTSFGGGGGGQGNSPATLINSGLDKGRQYCQQMDPDAAIRSGLPLHDLDKDDESRLFHYLYRLVRAGQLQDGKEIAERQGYFWLSAALEGWLLHHDPNYSSSSKAGGDDDEEEGTSLGALKQKNHRLRSTTSFNHQQQQHINGGTSIANHSTTTTTTIAGSAAIKLLEPVVGNPFRDLWKLTAWKCSKVEGTSLYERALFAVFSGNRAVLLPLCGAKWTDRLWAYFKCSLDVHLEELLGEATIPKPDQQPRTTVQLPDAYWDYKLSAEEIFREVNCTTASAGGISNSFSGVEKAGTGGGGAFSLQIEEEEYHQKVEQLIILGQVEQLVDRLYEWSKTIAGRREARARGKLLEQQQQQSVNASFSLFGGGDGLKKPILAANRAKEEEEELAKVVEPNLLRFFAHLVLALRNFELIADEKQDHLCDEVLETYIGFLIEYKLIELVAFYTLRLPEHRQVVVYATLLEGIEEEEGDRRLCLLVAQQAGLNLPAILATVVENIRTGNLGYQMAKRTASETATSVGTKKTSTLDGSFSSTSKLLKPQIPLSSALTEEDRRRINALDWLQLEPASAQYVELLVQGNALLRSFLLEQKVEHAKAAFEKIPRTIVGDAFEQWKTAHLQPNTSAIGSLDIDNVVREYVCHRTFFEAHEAFQKWHHYLYNSKPREPSRPKNLARLADRVAFEQATKAYEQELAVWQTALTAQAAQTAERLLAFLRFPEGVWVTVEDLKMMAEMAEADAHLAAAAAAAGASSSAPQHINKDIIGEEEEEGEGEGVIPSTATTTSSATVAMLLEAKRRDWSVRAGQLDALRRIYVPQFIFLLLSVHRGSGDLVQAVAVADIVADERARLHATFTGEQMADLLAKLREASIAALDATGGGDPLGYGGGGGGQRQQQQQ